METTLQGDGHRIWIPHDLPVDEVAEGNADVHVYLDDGRHFAGTIYTPKNVEWLMEKFRASGECASGAYFFDPTMVIVRDLKAETIRAVIGEMIRSGELEKAFVRAD